MTSHAKQISSLYDIYSFSNLNSYSFIITTIVSGNSILYMSSSTNYSKCKNV